ncbi:glycoside hydrolase family protein [Salix suchowensis]|nr:glycoside hydrolase family protein [Salix suchowensis]
MALNLSPSLDWVAKDTTSYSYPRTIYPDQQAFDPYNSDAGNGKFSNGSIISPPMNQSAAYTPWNASLAQQWLSSLQHIPTILALDNEIEIAHSTHQDMHPELVSYDEELERMVTFAKASKAALPNVAVAAPMTCSWWFYEEGIRHRGKRLLDYLDIHYYFQPDTSANDAAAKALRLRMTRSLWDKTYVDESWVGESPQNHQWDPDRVQLVPRFRTLIDIHYPGTKLAISEWSSTNDQDITGGLVTADALGIFGKYKVDAATYWYQPDEMGPVGLAFWLYRGYDRRRSPPRSSTANCFLSYGVYFGNKSAQVNLATPNPDTVGVYAATENNKLSLVIINKDTKPLPTICLTFHSVHTSFVTLEVVPALPSGK